jgi:hypothetical protein
MALALDLSGDHRADAQEIARKQASGDHVPSTIAGAGIILALLYLADTLRELSEGGEA